MFGQKEVNKEAIIAEYLAGGISYRRLGEKYGIDFRIINYWVLEYQGKEGKGKKSPSKEETVQSILSTTEQPNKQGQPL
jgi:transposase-like protein